MVDNEELAADADVEWHLHRNKKLPGSGIAKDIQKYVYAQWACRVARLRVVIEFKLTGARAFLQDL